MRLKLTDELFSSHLLVVGDTGAGKSTCLKQILNYIQDNGDCAVVLDSKLEFIEEFYDPRRGDKILSPKDNRCAYWDLANEVTDEADAMATMRAFYPLKPNNPQGEWFDDQAAKIGAYLLANSNPRPSCTDFGYWLAHPDEIYKRIKNSEHEQTLDKNAAGQKAGILGNMNKVGFAFRMMPGPSERQYREDFTISQWAKDRNGWLFLPNTSETRDALQPLQGGWADMAILRIMSCQQHKKRVWIVLDELDSIGKLSKLQEGMSMLRSTGNPMVLGMQNPAQLEDRYGRPAKTIFSQAYRKFVFAVTEPESAQGLENLIGQEERMRYRESRSGSLMGTQDRNNFSGPEYDKRPVVLKDEIQGLPNLMGIFLQRPVDGKVGLNVVPIKLKWKPPIKHCEGLVERRIPSMNQRPLEPKPIAGQREQPSEAVAKNPPMAVVEVSEKEINAVAAAKGRPVQSMRTEEIMRTPDDQLPADLQRELTVDCPRCGETVTGNIKVMLAPCPHCGEPLLDEGQEHPESVDYEQDQQDMQKEAKVSSLPKAVQENKRTAIPKKQKVVVN